MMASARPTFQPGDAVRIQRRHHEGHHRTPAYLKGQRGIVDHVMDEARNPETLAYGQDGTPRIRVYQVRFTQRELWPSPAGGPKDSLHFDVFEHWLEHAD